MRPERKLALVTRGAVAARDFLRGFDWPRDREVHAHLIEAARATC